MDKFIVRASAILINAYIPLVLVFAINGIDISVYDYMFSSNIMFGIVLSVLSHAQGKYHCKWIRGLCYNSVAVPSVCYIDASCNLFSDAMIFIYTIATVWCVGVLTTIILAINHFRRVRKVLNKQRHEEIRPIEYIRRRKD